MKFNYKGLIKCDAKNLIYGIYCEKCKNMIYVRETINNLYQRHQLNLSRIRTGRNLEPVSAHFRNENHSVRDYGIIGIEKTNKNEEYRKTREIFLINKLKTWKPLGLNVKNV